MNMQTPATAPSNRFVKLSVLHRDKGKPPGVPKLKNRTVKSQHYLNYQISLAVQIPPCEAGAGCGQKLGESYIYSSLKQGLGGGGAC